MFRRQPIEPDSTPATTNPSATSRRAALSDALWDGQDRLRTGSGEALRTLAELVRCPFERIAWALRRGLLWPIEDRAGTLSGPIRALSFGLVVLLAAAAGVGGLIWAAPDKPDHSAAAAAAVVVSEPVVAAVTAPEAPAAPTLQGAAPVFKPAKGQDPAEVDPAEAIEKSAPKQDSSSGSSEKISSTTAGASTSSAQTVKDDGKPAGPAAISVARDFAGAFVLYETGKGNGDVRKAFAETATPELTRSLMRRPPRLPANVKVPQAKVVNVVPGPSRAGVYTVSVSLLRVGLTSELRLDMEQLKGDRWRVTNVLG